MSNISRRHKLKWQFDGIFGFVGVSPKIQGAFTSNCFHFPNFPTFVTVSPKLFPVPLEDQESSRYLTNLWKIYKIFFWPLLIAKVKDCIGASFSEGRANAFEVQLMKYPPLGQSYLWFSRTSFSSALFVIALVHLHCSATVWTTLGVSGQLAAGQRAMVSPSMQPE